MYDKPSPATIAKESVQNALDAIDSGGERKVVIGSAGNVYYCRDYGPGFAMLRASPFTRNPTPIATVGNPYAQPYTPLAFKLPGFVGRAYTPDSEGRL